MTHAIEQGTLVTAVKSTKNWEDFKRRIFTQPPVAFRSTPAAESESISAAGKVVCGFIRTSDMRNKMYAAAGRAVLASKRQR